MRITLKMLEIKVKYLNEITDNPVGTYTKDADGKFHANLGNYHLSGAYGGWSLHQMQTDGGGVRDIFYAGHMPKRELFDRMA
ncbi:unnamed protein product, partial [marine sediment metagenome]